MSPIYCDKTTSSVLDCRDSPTPSLSLPKDPSKNLGLLRQEREKKGVYTHVTHRVFVDKNLILFSGSFNVSPIEIVPTKRVWSRSLFERSKEECTLFTGGETNSVIIVSKEFQKTMNVVFTNEYRSSNSWRSNKLGYQLRIISGINWGVVVHRICEGEENL